MVPTGWDSWGKINVLREGFDPGRVGKAWEIGLVRAVGEDDDGEEGIEDLWIAMIPDTERGSKVRLTAYADYDASADIVRRRGRLHR
jgi:dynein light intermediate chain 1